MKSSLHVKVATEPWEFDEIHALNHQAFAEEIPRYQSTASRRLVDRFHDENVYVIGLDESRLAGMAAVRGRRPFSLEERMPDLDSYLPPGRSMCELRLLVVERHHRLGRLLPALLEGVWRYCREQRYDLALISGITRQLHLYRHLGFEPFGPLVGTPEAQFQPMMLTLERFVPRAGKLFRRVASNGAPVLASFLPGPVTMREEVREAFRGPAQSHRSLEFVEQVRATRMRLCRLVRASRVELLLGSGTLANDAIAGQLSLEDGHGLVLSNGEFGERLIDHAHRFQLRFDAMSKPWGEPFSLGEIGRRLSARSRPAWLWLVHCETSTGVLNDLDRVRALCAEAGVRLSVDAISSIGTVPVDLTGVYFASGVSGKGLGAFPGLALVFHHHEIAPAPRGLPRYLDLELYARHGSIPFTQSSNLVHALDASLTSTNWAGRFLELAEHGVWLRARLRELGLAIVAPDKAASPAVVTIALPASSPTAKVAAALAAQGYLASANSRYLLERNWIQISLMDETSRVDLVEVTSALSEICGSCSSAAATLQS